MSRPRVPLLDAEDAATAAADVGVPAAMAELNIFRLLLRLPRTAKAVNDLLLSMLFGGALDDRRRELLIMRMGWATGSEYEWTQHWTVAQDSFGCDPDDLLAVRDWHDDPRFDAADRLVLRAVDETLESGMVSERTIEQARDLLDSDEAVVELVMAIATWQSISHVARSLDIPLEDGVASWPPDGASGPT
ncbi:MAG: carboxymuconolactone decarboxylase family protein [Acidimicrobiales bacterium]